MVLVRSRILIFVVAAAAVAALTGLKGAAQGAAGEAVAGWQELTAGQGATHAPGERRTTSTAMRRSRPGPGSSATWTTERGVSASRPSRSTH